MYNPVDMKVFDSFPGEVPVRRYNGNGFVWLSDNCMMHPLDIFVTSNAPLQMDMARE